jgi:hypothetical protein
MYYGQAQSTEVPAQHLQLSVKALADACKDHKGFENHKNLIEASAHLNSCAVRLYAIEECISSERLQNYKNIRERGDACQIRDEINKSTQDYIHFLLRHMVAHSESKRLDSSKYKTAYEVMYESYLRFQFCFIFKKLEAAMGLIHGDIKGRLAWS